MSSNEPEIKEQPKEYTKEEFMTKFKTMEADLKDIKEFMSNIMKAVDTPKEPGAGKKKDWTDDFFGLD